MTIQAHLATLQRRHRALEMAIHTVQMHPSWDESEVTELKRRKLLVMDKIVRLRRDIGAHASGAHAIAVPVSAAEKKRTAMRMHGLKASDWYEGASRSIAITKARPS